MSTMTIWHKKLSVLNYQVLMMKSRSRVELGEMLCAPPRLRLNTFVHMLVCNNLLYLQTCNSHSRTSFKECHFIINSFRSCKIQLLPLSHIQDYPSQQNVISLSEPAFSTMSLKNGKKPAVLSSLPSSRSP